MGFHLNLTHNPDPKPRPSSVFRSLGQSLGLVLIALATMVIGDSLLAGGRFSSLLIDDAVSGYLAARNVVSDYIPK